MSATLLLNLGKLKDRLNRLTESDPLVLREALKELTGLAIALAMEISELRHKLEEVA